MSKSNFKFASNRSPLKPSKMIVGRGKSNKMKELDTGSSSSASSTSSSSTSSSSCSSSSVYTSSDEYSSESSDVSTSGSDVDEDSDPREKCGGRRPSASRLDSNKRQKHSHGDRKSAKYSLRKRTDGKNVRPKKKKTAKRHDSSAQISSQTSKKKRTQPAITGDAEEVEPNGEESQDAHCDGDDEGYEDDFDSSTLALPRKLVQGILMGMGLPATGKTSELRAALKRALIKQRKKKTARNYAKSRSKRTLSRKDEDPAAVASSTSSRRKRAAEAASAAAASSKTRIGRTTKLKQPPVKSRRSSAAKPSSRSKKRKTTSSTHGGGRSSRGRDARSDEAGASCTSSKRQRRSAGSGIAAQAGKSIAKSKTKKKMRTKKKKGEKKAAAGGSRGRGSRRHGKSDETYEPPRSAHGIRGGNNKLLHASVGSKHITDFFEKRSPA